MTYGYLSAAVNGSTGCTPCSCCWYVESGTWPPMVHSFCARYLKISKSTSYPFGMGHGNPYYMGINFANRGLIAPDCVDPPCGSYDNYVIHTYDGEGGDDGDYAAIDVWQAHRDGIWSSSVTIGVHLCPANTAVNDMIISVYGGVCAVASTGTIRHFDPYPSIDCAHYALYATVTVNANGTYSIA
jgi:hypothetical protein